MSAEPSVGPQAEDPSTQPELGCTSIDPGAKEADEPETDAIYVATLRAITTLRPSQLVCSGLRRY